MRTLYARIVGALVLMGMPAVAGGADPRQRFQVEKFSQTADLGSLPAEVGFALHLFVRGGAIANSTEPFEATDVISNPKLPRRRLIGAGTSGDLTFVEYEHGGLGLHQHFALFQTKGTTAVVVGACSGLLPRELEKLKKVVGTSACLWQATEH